MIYPTINDLSKGKYNRYEVALATAKCARIITNEYVRQRAEADAVTTGNKEGDKPVNAMIDREFRDEKAVKLAINRIYEGKYAITQISPEEQEKAEREFLAQIKAVVDRSMRREENAFAESEKEDNEVTEAEEEDDDDDKIFFVKDEDKIFFVEDKTVATNDESSDEE